MENLHPGIRGVIYLDDKYAELDNVRASKRLFQAAGVRVRHFVPEQGRLTLNFDQKKEP